MSYVNATFKDLSYQGTRWRHTDGGTSMAFHEPEARFEAPCRFGFGVAASRAGAGVLSMLCSARSLLVMGQLLCGNELVWWYHFEGYQWVERKGRNDSRQHLSRSFDSLLSPVCPSSQSCYRLLLERPRCTCRWEEV